MLIELDSQEREMLSQLVTSRIAELGPEIRRCRTSTYHDEMKEQSKALQRLQQRLQALEMTTF